MIKLKDYNLNIKVTYGDNTQKDLSYKDLISFEIQHNSKDAQLSLKPGLIEQSYNLKFYDRNNLFKNSFDNLNAKKQLFKKYFEIEISSNTLTDILVPSNDLLPSDNLYPSDGINVASSIRYRGYYVDIDYEIKNKTVTIKATDVSSNLAKLNINKASVSTRTIDDLFKYALSNNYSYADASLETLCKNTILPDTFVVAQTYRELIDKICKAAMVNIYVENYNGTTDKYVIRRCY